MKKKTIALLLILVLSTTLAGCSDSSIENGSNDQRAESIEQEQPEQNEDQDENTKSYDEQIIVDGVNKFVQSTFGYADYEFQSIDITKISESIKSVGGEAEYMDASGLLVYFIFLCNYETGEASGYEVDYNQSTTERIDRQNTFFDNNMPGHEDI
jgi:hypothetical protein